MKKFLFISLFFVTLQLSAQEKMQHNCGNIFYGAGNGVIAKEFCWFDTTCSSVVIDTSNHANIWQIGKPQKTIFNMALTAPNAIVTDTVNYYPIKNHSYFDFVFPLVTNLGPDMFTMNMCVSFKHKVNTDTMKDGGFIEVQYHKDSVWQNIAYDTMHYSYWQMPMFFYCENLYGVNDTLHNGMPGFSGNTDWVRTQMQWIWMIPVKGSMYFPDTLRLRFHFLSDSINTNKEGWMIDSLEVTAYDPGSSIYENGMDDKISVAPNPVINTAVVELKIPDAGKFEAELYNVFGQKVMDFPNIKSNRFSLNRANHENGMYFLILKKDNQILATKKLFFM